jgi:hypothetical protein
MVSFVLRFLVIAALLGLVAVREGEQVTQALLPLFKAELAVLDGTFRVDRVYVDRDGADQVVRVNVGLARPLTINGYTFRPDPRGEATSSTLVGNVTLPCVLLAAVALAWPVRERRTLAIRVLLLIPALLLVCLLEAPFILWGALWGLVIQVAHPNGFCLPLIWSEFLVGGGGMALAIALGAALGSLTGRRFSFS